MSAPKVLPERSLGKQGFKGSTEGFGCMSLTPFFGASVYEGAEETLKHVIDQGVTVLNTSDLYGPYVNEELVGRVIKNYPRESIKISTKWGPMFGPDHKMVADLSPKACRAACEGSLKRLGVDYIDLWVLRGPARDPNTPFEETIKAMKELVEEGKVKYLGLSEISAANIRKAHAIHPITALEMEWSLFSRDAEEEIVPTARELGIGFLVYSPLGRGLLTGAIKSKEDLGPMAGHNPRATGEHFEKNLKLVENLDALAKKKGVTPGQLAIAWVLARGDDVIPIPGTKRKTCVDENLAAVHIRLTPEDLQELEDAVPHHQVSGDRYHDMKATSYRGEA